LPASLQAIGLRRAMHPPSPSIAFAPAAITNFFEISYNSPRPTGATGGGYILSKGSTTSATVTPAKGRVLSDVVNGDASYDARTTRRAVKLLLSGTGVKGKISLVQEVQTPIGAGFGASAASATSAVYAVAHAARIDKQRSEIALYAHKAEILEQTGLGTVSVIFDAVGAGAITVSGEPGRARFVAVKVPDGTRIVTAFIAPFDKKDALSSKSVSQRINRLGHESLRNFLSDPSLDTLAGEGERFSGLLGLESVEVKKLIRLAKAAGASHASQNMIGYAVHSVVGPDDAERVATALLGYSRDARIDVFEVGTRKAGYV